MEFLSIFDENNETEDECSINRRKIVMEDSSSLINKTKQRKKKKSTKSLKFLRFSPANAIPQNFPFLSTFMRYILENQNFVVHRKLQKCCKYFFIINPTVICENLISNNSIKTPIGFNHESIVIGSPDFKFPNSYNISVEKALKFNFSENRLALSQIVPRINQCRAKYVAFQNQNLSFNEIKILIGCGNVKELELVDVNIIENDKNDAIAKIIKLIPNVKSLKFSGFLISSSTFESLTNFKFNEKLTNLFIESINMENCDPKYLIRFLLNNISTKSITRIDLKSELLWEDIREKLCHCHDLIQNTVRSAFADEEQPRLDIYFHSRGVL